MKHILFSITVILGLAVVITSCKGDEGDDPTPAQLMTQALTGDYKASSSKTWNVTKVEFNPGFEDRTSQWSGFSLTLSSNPDGNNQYSTTSAFSPGPWPASGTWTFGGTVDNPNTQLIVRDSAPEELDMAISSGASETTLVLVFTFDDAVHRSGRTEVVNGEYTFTFSSN